MKSIIEISLCLAFFASAITNNTIAATAETSAPQPVQSPNPTPVADRTAWWMITSPANMKAYATENSNAGFASIGGRGIVYNAGVTFIWAEGGTANEKIAKMDDGFIIDVLDPDHDTDHYVSSQQMMRVGNNWYTTFWGGGWGYIEKDPVTKKYNVETSQIELKLLDGEIPISVGSDVVSAMIYYRDDSVNIQWEDYLRVDEGGVILYKNKYLGKLGQLVLYKNDGSHRIIDLKKGVETTAQSIAVNVSIAIPNYTEDNDGGLIMPTKANPNWLFISKPIKFSYDRADAPVARVMLNYARVIDVPSGVVNINGNDEWPTVKAIGPSGQIVYSTPVTDGSKAIMTDEPGLWLVTWDYRTLFGALDQPTYPYNGGGYSTTTGKAN